MAAQANDGAQFGVQCSMLSGCCNTLIILLEEERDSDAVGEM